MPIRTPVIASVLLTVAIGLALLPAQAHAHNLQYAAATTRLEADGSQIRLHTVAPNDFVIDAPDEDAQKQAAGEYVADKFRLGQSDQPCRFKLSKFVGQPQSAPTIDGVFDCPQRVGKVEDLTIHSELLADSFSNFDHFVTFQVSGHAWRMIFTPGHKDYPQDVSAEPTAASQAPAHSPRQFFAVAGQFLWMGMLHIFTGYDHILFLITVILLMRSLKKIVILVTTFTVAHTITLLLAGLHILAISPRIVEPIIALSIVYMSARNFRRLRHESDDENTSERQAAVAGFGLIHGLGFASVLTQTPIPNGYFVPALAFFNIGIEVGQLAILLALVPLLRLADRIPHRNRILSWVSIGIVVLASIWFIQRI